MKAAATNAAARTRLPARIEAPEPLQRPVDTQYVPGYRHN
jgi:hypothetical protein